MVRIPASELADLPGPIRALAREIREAGGRGFLVGGAVRDRLRGEPAADWDLEVHGLSIDRLEEVLSAHGQVIAVGRAFGVLRLTGIDADFSVPRRDSRIGTGHRGFRAELDPALSPEDAVRRRDLTVNALMLDPLTGEVLDPAGGLADMRQHRLRAVDPLTFPEDPLRPLRVAQLAARLEYDVDQDLLALCRSIDLSALPAERVWDEWEKMLLLGRRPSLGLEFLRAAELLALTPELQALIGVLQDPEWHPEGDVWEHTLRSADAAARLRVGERAADLPLMFGALCHDLGKAVTTELVKGRWHSYEHEVVGVALAHGMLARLGAPGWLVTAVGTLVRWHLQPAALHHHGGGPRAYRRLARALQAGGVQIKLLERVARADSLGRTTPEALAGVFPEGDRFLREAEALAVHDAAPADVVLGRHLIGRGLPPGPGFGPILARCREVQDETGWTDPDRILDEALGRSPRPGPTDDPAARARKGR